jgi:hypothetical protein
VLFLPPPPPPVPHIIILSSVAVVVARVVVATAAAVVVGVVVVVVVVVVGVVVVGVVVVGVAVVVATVVVVVAAAVTTHFLDTSAQLYSLVALQHFYLIMIGHVSLTKIRLTAVYNFNDSVSEATNEATPSVKPKTSTYPHCFFKYLIYYIQKKNSYLTNIRNLILITVIVFFMLS